MKPQHYQQIVMGVLSGQRVPSYFPMPGEASDSRMRLVLACLVLLEQPLRSVDPPLCAAKGNCGLHGGSDSPKATQPGNARASQQFQPQA